ncbi:hypothetical protein HD806DRAFT_517381 [Xylariaceae sp. AK1471]|nr:hypothetical protein HD806DRAFT_517381 [Xylariaceae sp. AK1471]
MNEEKDMKEKEGNSILLLSWPALTTIYTVTSPYNPWLPQPRDRFSPLLSVSPCHNVALFTLVMLVHAPHRINTVN